MTAVFYTVDTELSPGLHQRGMTPVENLNAAVLGKTGAGEWGIRHQIERLNAHRLKGVFFVEALCAHLGDGDILARIVEPILSGGHEVQLHVHTEWLDWMNTDPVDGRRGANISDFDIDDQRRLLDLGLEALVKAGVPTPTAFRAGNYGANNDTLRALHDLGIRYDSSYNQPYLGRECAIIAPMLEQPTTLEGVVEVPITWFEDFPGHTRPLQLAAVSAAELKWVVDNCASHGRPSVVIVSHSFELLNRKRERPNRMLVQRFEAFCALLKAASDRAPTTTFTACDFAAAGAAPSNAAPMRSSATRTARRVLEQSVGNLLYDVF